MEFDPLSQKISNPWNVWELMMGNAPKQWKKLAKDENSHRAHPDGSRTLEKREFRGKIPKKSEREKARFGVGEGHHERCSEENKENKENKENTEYK